MAIFIIGITKMEPLNEDIGTLYVSVATSFLKKYFSGESERCWDYYRLGGENA